MNLKRVNKSIAAIAVIAAVYGMPCVLEAQTISKMQYNLPLAKKISYTSMAEAQYVKGSSGSIEELQIWVLGQNEDRSRRLIIRNHSSFYRIDEDGNRKDYPPEVKWAMCDFYTNGHMAPSWTLDNMWRLDLYLPNLFIPLPEDLTAEHVEWNFTGRMFGEWDHYVLDKPVSSDTVWIIKVVHATPLDSIYLMSTKAELHFNIKQGLPVYKEIESTRGYGRYAGKGTATITLDSIINLDTIWVKDFARELAVYFEADSVYSELIAQAEIIPEKMDSLLIQAEATLKEAREKVTIPDIQKQLGQAIVNYTEDAKYIAEGMQRRTGLINKTSVAWTAYDFNGKEHSLKQYQKNVILLDFWYRGCPWCIRAMPQINQIAQYFKGRPVAVLGMNVDKDKDDALFVIDKLKLMYTNLSAGEVPQQYGVRGYPTLIIIDQKGIVRDIHVGYSDDLYDKVVKSIEFLLGEK